MYILFTNSHSYIFSKFEPKTTCFYDQLPNLPHITTKLTWNYPRFNKLCHTTSPHPQHEKSNYLQCYSTSNYKLSVIILVGLFLPRCAFTFIIIRITFIVSYKDETTRNAHTYTISKIVGARCSSRT